MRIIKLALFAVMFLSVLSWADGRPEPGVGGGSLNLEESFNAARTSARENRREALDNGIVAMTRQVYKIEEDLKRAFYVYNDGQQVNGIWLLNETGHYEDYIRKDPNPEIAKAQQEASNNARYDVALLARKLKALLSRVPKDARGVMTPLGDLDRALDQFYRTAIHLPGDYSRAMDEMAESSLKYTPWQDAVKEQRSFIAKNKENLDAIMAVVQTQILPSLLQLRKEHATAPVNAHHGG